MTTLRPMPLPEFAAGWLPVNAEELARLMGMPGSRAFDEQTRQTVAATEQWCRQHVVPWRTQRLLEISQVDETGLTLEDGTRLRAGEAFRRKLIATRAHALIIFAFTAGDALDRRAGGLWAAEQFQESYVMRAYGSGLAEASRARHSVALCNWAEEQDWAILSSDGPGYRDWPLAEMHELYRLLAKDSGVAFIEKLRINEEGMLQPLYSTVVVFGVTAFKDSAAQTENWIPCCECDLSPCRFRRRPLSVLGRAVRL